MVAAERPYLWVLFGGGVLYGRGGAEVRTK